jgi:hypothetical protein
MRPATRYTSQHGVASGLSTPDSGPEDLVHG